ncbi:hypothetical protein H4582DRAFT_2062549 [Lactarius indigo]|nr:hypothetical protein H4582DRAFT_2062549 [Lactarius indigo]
MASSNPPLEITLNTTMALQGFLFVLPANGRIVINLGGNKESKMVATGSVSASAMKTTLSRGGDSERKSQVQTDGVSPAAILRDATENQQADRPVDTMTASGPAMETALSRGGESKHDSQVDGDNLATCAKRPRNLIGDQEDEPVKRQARGDPKGSRLKTTGPQYVPATQGELVELPPMPKSLYDEVMASPIDSDSATEPESSDYERDVRKNLKLLT